MDVYGAFQLCSIAILVAPMTVRLSQTYFNTRGRNTIFLWAGLILAGEHFYPFWFSDSDACLPSISSSLKVNVMNSAANLRLAACRTP